MNTSDCILLAVLLAFSAYFSASETALSTVNKIRLKSYADNGSKKAKIALDIAENYDRTSWASSSCMTPSSSMVSRIYLSSSSVTDGLLSPLEQSRTMAH